MTAKEASRRLGRFDVELWVGYTIEETAKQFIDLNTDQMAHGQLNDGSKNAPPYSPKYAIKRAKLGLPTRIVDFKVTGDFYDKMAVKVDNNLVRIGSEVDYDGYLTGRAGPKLWGLNPKNRKTYLFGPFWSVLKQKVLEQTGLGYG